MKVLHFGDSDRRLLGTFHHPQRLRARSAAVLLCNPFGEEATRAHRIYRVLASQLERAGYPVLRFDYSGTGDSSGDDAEASVERWLRDVTAAADELRTLSAAKRLVAIGMRLGATLAALATARAELRLRHLVLWDPVVEGAAYLDELAAMHRSYMREELGDRWADRLAVSGGVPAETLGTAIAPALGAGLAAIDLAAEPPRADHVTVVSTRATPALDRLRARLTAGPTTRWIEMAASQSWNSDAALNAATVPMDVVQAVIARVEETSP